MVKIIFIKSPDEWTTTKQTCRDELVVYLSISSHNIYAFLYRLMFWNALGNTPKVEKSNLDGTQRFAMVTSNLTWPSGITLDRRNKLVYWVDEFRGAIESVDYNGNNRTLLFQQNGLNFYSVSFISPYLFITGWTRNWIYKFDVFNGTVVSVISLSRGGAYGLVAYDSYRQTWGL